LRNNDVDERNDGRCDEVEVDKEDGESDEDEENKVVQTVVWNVLFGILD
jgi:hypothetical protein